MSFSARDITPKSASQSTRQRLLRPNPDIGEVDSLSQARSCLRTFDANANSRDAMRSALRDKAVTAERELNVRSLPIKSH